MKRSSSGYVTLSDAASLRRSPRDQRCAAAAAAAARGGLCGAGAAGGARVRDDDVRGACEAGLGCGRDDLMNVAVDERRKTNHRSGPCCSPRRFLAAHSLPPAVCSC